jgi:NADH-quinone oxidoreductase subunit J
MSIIFYLAAAVAVAATLMMVTRSNSVHALLYLVVSLLAVAVVFYVMGAPFIAALEVIIYAGAIMVLFIFVVMMLNAGDRAIVEKSWLHPKTWFGPIVLAAILLGEVIFILMQAEEQNRLSAVVSPRQVGMDLFGPYLIGVELASMLLLGGLVGAYHLGRSWSMPSKVED